MPKILDARLTDREAQQLAPLALAYIGDTIFDLYVRKKLVLDKSGGAGAMHHKSTLLVNARSQAHLARLLVDELEGAELDIFMRGRNAKTNTVPKNMSIADYHHATAIEALVGYLYLTGRTERVESILERLEETGEKELS